LGKRIRIWSAGCSSGEEPFSIAILLRDRLPDVESRDVKILATDICSEVLDKAKRAVYTEEEVQDLPSFFLRKYFTPVVEDGVKAYKVRDEVRAMVRFARLNLKDEWPMRGPFDIIFCRNVMIYFDQSTRQELVNRFWDMLKPGGYLFIGHSESLASLSHEFKYVQPAVYVKA